jgi:hypothetical protein
MPGGRARLFRCGELLSVRQMHSYDHAARAKVRRSLIRRAVSQPQPVQLGIDKWGYPFMRQPRSPGDIWIYELVKQSLYTAGLTVCSAIGRIAQ